MLRAVPHLQLAANSCQALCQTPTQLAMRTSLRISRSQVSVKRLCHSTWTVEGLFSSIWHARLSTKSMSLSHLPSHPNLASFSALSPLYVPQVTLLLLPAVTRATAPSTYLSVPTATLSCCIFSFSNSPRSKFCQLLPQQSL